MEWLKEVEARGQTPYPHKFDVSDVEGAKLLSVPQFRETFDTIEKDVGGKVLRDRVVAVAGRIYGLREQGKRLCFLRIEGDGFHLQVQFQLDYFGKGPKEVSGSL